MFTLEKIVKYDDVLDLREKKNSGAGEGVTLVRYKPLKEQVVYLVIDPSALPTSLTTEFTSRNLTELYVVTVTASRLDYRHPMTEHEASGSDSDAGALFTLMRTWESKQSAFLKNSAEASLQLEYDAQRTKMLELKVERLVSVQYNSNTEWLAAWFGRLYYEEFPMQGVDGSGESTTHKRPRA